MNICVISPGYPYLDHMYYVFVKKLVDEWAKVGHKCVVLTAFSWTSYVRKIKKYVPWHYTDNTCKDNPVEVYNPRYVSIPEVEIGGVEINRVIISRKMFRLLNNVGFQPDLIYCHFFSTAIFGWYISKKLNIPLFVASGESKIDKVYPPSRDFSLSLFRDSINGCICVSSKNKEEAIGLGLITADKCIVIPNATDLTLFKKLNRNECRKKLGFRQDDFIVSCVGSFIERKGQNRIIDAVKKMANSKIKLVFIGKGRLILEHENIIFKGQVNNVDIPVYLNASNIFCLPTLAEGCCNAVIEAMACGLPIVSSDLPFNHDVLDEQNSILVDPRSIDEIAAAIKHLYDDKELCEHFSKVSLERISALSIEQRAKTVMEFIEYRI